MLLHSPVGSLDGPSPRPGTPSSLFSSHNTHYLTMGERKVLNQYYPPDFDPSKLPRAKKVEANMLKVRDARV